jgi:hypothetical protein
MTLWRRVYEERKSLVLPLLIVLVANVGVLLLAVLPLRTSVAAQQSAAAEARSGLDAAKRVEKQVQQARASKERADGELQKFYTAVLPRDFAAAQRMANLWLNEAAQDAGLVFRGNQFDRAEKRDSRLSRAYSRVVLRGRYADIRRFL